MGIYSLEKQSCGCEIRNYVGGTVVVSGCQSHEANKYYICPSCGIRFDFGAELKRHRWDHAI